MKPACTARAASPSASERSGNSSATRDVALTTTGGITASDSAAGGAGRGWLAPVDGADGVADGVTVVAGCDSTGAGVRPPNGSRRFVLAQPDFFYQDTATTETAAARRI